MMKQTALVGLMLALGAVPLATVNALVDNGCARDDYVHNYYSGGGFTIWESKKNDLLLFGIGIGSVTETCVDPGNPMASDGDFETGIGAARLQVGPSAIDPMTGESCSPTRPHHTTRFYVRDLILDQGLDFQDVVSGSYGWDGTTNELGTLQSTPCGDGIIDPNDPQDCLAYFWDKAREPRGQGPPHGPCFNPITGRTFGLDGAYWVFVDTLTVNLDIQDLAPVDPRIGASILGCIWTDDYKQKEPKADCISKT